jgi:hypothetical protein
LKKKKKNLEVWKKKIEDRVGICIDWKLKKNTQTDESPG